MSDTDNKRELGIFADGGEHEPPRRSKLFQQQRQQFAERSHRQQEQQHGWQGSHDAG